MATLRIDTSGDGVVRLLAATQALAGSKAHTALRRALNHTGRKAYTLVKRTLAHQMGLSSQKALSQGRTLVARPASGAGLEFAIVSGGRAVRAKEFRHSIGKSGITFYPWRSRKFIKSAFVIPRYGGNFYRRRTSKRFPLEALYGPNINKELVKDASAAAFRTVVARDLPARVAHEIKVITNGVVS